MTVQMEDFMAFKEMKTEQLFAFFEYLIITLRKKKTVKDEFSFGLHKEGLRKVFLELNRREVMNFVDYQKVLKELRTFEKRYKEVA